MARPKSADPRSKQVNLRFTEDEHEALCEYAVRADMALNDLCRQKVLQLIRDRKVVASKNNK